MSNNKTRIAKQGSTKTQFALCRLHGLSQLKGYSLRMAVTSACLFHPNGCPIHVVSHLHGNSICMAVTIVFCRHTMRLYRAINWMLGTQNNNAPPINTRNSGNLSDIRTKAEKFFHKGPKQILWKRRNPPNIMLFYEPCHNLN